MRGPDLAFLLRVFLPQTKQLPSLPFPSLPVTKEEGTSPPPGLTQLSPASNSALCCHSLPCSVESFFLGVYPSLTQHAMSVCSSHPQKKIRSTLSILFTVVSSDPKDCLAHSGHSVCVELIR